MDEQRVNSVKIAAGIVLHNPDLQRLAENIKSVYSQVEILVLVDNNSFNIEIINNIYDRYPKISIIRNNQNLGIATALNQIIEYCIKLGYEWVLTLDQDSVCPDNLISEYLKWIDAEKMAILSPTIIDRNKIDKHFSQTKQSDLEIVDKCITSGSLINAGVWSKIGKFDEVMFIDEVDFEYCQRVIDCGFLIYRANNTKLLHEIGKITIHRFLFWNVTVKNHNSFRKYFMARNVLYVAFKQHSFFVILKAYLRVFKILIVTILYENDKINKAKSIIKGCRDSRLIRRE